MTSKMDPSEIELHDALLKGGSVDFSKGLVFLFVDFYRSESEKNRDSLEIKFEGVRSLSGLCDFVALKKNAFAGNVNYWIPGETTYFYLTDGCISIVADNVSCRDLPTHESHLVID